MYRAPCGQSLAYHTGQRSADLRTRREEDLIADEGKVLHDDALGGTSGGCGNSGWLQGWHPYDGSKGVLLCPNCMRTELRHFESLGFERFRCSACKHEFAESEAGIRVSGEF